MAGVLRRFSFVTAAEKQLKQQKHYKKHCLVVGLEKVVFREGNCQGRRELPARAVLLVFKEIYSCLFIPNCTPKSCDYLDKHISPSYHRDQRKIIARIG